MKVAVNIRTKKIVDLLPDNATANTSFLINNGYIMLDIENPILNHVENEDGIISTTFRELTSAELLPYALKDINKEYEDAVRNLTIDTPDSEKQTWLKQESEARAYKSDNMALTPLIDAMCETRNCTKEYIVNKIIEKADAYAVAIGRLTGLRQKQEKLITQGDQ